LVSFGRRVTESAQAEELTQETFVALLRAATRYEPRALFRTYLHAIGFKILRASRRKAAFRATFFGRQNSAPDPSRRDASESGLWVRRAVEKKQEIEIEKTHRDPLLLFNQAVTVDCSDFLGTALIHNNDIPSFAPITDLYFVVTNAVDGSSNKKKTTKNAPKEWRVPAPFCGIL